MNAEAIARRILDHYAGPYYACGETAHAARERVVQEAAKEVQTLMQEKKK